MGLVLADLIGDMSDEERASRQAWIDRTRSNDEWAMKIFNKVGILITSHQGNRPYLKASIESHAKLGYWMVLAYDNFIDPTWPAQEFSYDRFMPAKDVIEKVDTFLMPHHQVWGGVLYPFYWLMHFGVDCLSQFEYIYCVNGDFVLEKPENFQRLFEFMGNDDVMSYGPNTETSVSTCFIAKTAALKAIMKHYKEHFIPWENYEKYTQEYGNAESRFARAIKDLGLKLTAVEPPNNEQMHVPGKGTWYDLVGFRHIHGEMNYSYRYKKPVTLPFYRYLDERYLSDSDKRYLQIYEASGKIEDLNDWYAKE